MTPTSLQAGVIAICTQAVALVVGFGILNNTTAGFVTSLSVAVINVAFLIAHSIHATASAKVAAAQVASRAVK